MAYIHVRSDAGNLRIKARDIVDFRPCFSDVLALEPDPNKTTIRLKNGTEIDVDMSIAELRKHIRWP